MYAHYKKNRRMTFGSNGYDGLDGQHESNGRSGCDGIGRRKIKGVCNGAINKVGVWIRQTDNQWEECSRHNNCWDHIIFVTY